MGLTTNGLGKSGARPSISIWTTDPPGKCKNGSKITGSFANYAIDLKKYRWRCCRPARLWKKPNPRNFEYHPPNKSKPTPRDPRNVGYVGSEIDLVATCAIRRYTSLQAGIARFFVGD